MFKFKNLKWRKHIWNNKLIAFISILIAISVVFVLIFTSIIPIASVPSLKLMAGGLPIKITGYIFGAFIGGITGVLSDLISFAYRPVFFHPWYLLAWAGIGIIPGIFSFFMNKKWKPYQDFEQEINNKYLKTNFLITICILIIIFISVFLVIWYTPNNYFHDLKLIKRKYIFLIISLFGISTMFFAIIIFRFIFKPKTFNKIMPIIAFSAILEFVSLTLVSLGDREVLFQKADSILTIVTGHLLLSPIKIWGNLIVIYFAYKNIAPLIYSKTNNQW